MTAADTNAADTKAADDQGRRAKASDAEPADARSASPAPTTREERVRLLKRRVVRATLPSFVLPGLGQLGLAKLVPSQRLWGVALMAAFLGGIAAAAWHLLFGLWLFESALGSFLFGALLRALLIVQVFSMVDGYFCALRPEDDAGLLRRRAVALNMLVPGLGFALTRTWVRAGMGAGVCALVVVFALHRYHRFIDVIFVALQLVIAATTQQQQRLAEADESGTVAPPRPVADPVAVAQIALLFAVLAAVGATGLVVYKRMPGYAFAGLQSKAVSISPRSNGIRVRVPVLGLSLRAAGSGWIAERKRAGLLFEARHHKNISLRLGAELILPFVKPARHALTVRARVEGGGYKHERTKVLRVHGRTVYQMRFSRQQSGQTIDQWSVMYPRGNTAFLLLIECNRVRCKQALADLETTVQSVKLAPSVPR